MTILDSKDIAIPVFFLTVQLVYLEIDCFLWEITWDSMRFYNRTDHSFGYECHDDWLPYKFAIIITLLMAGFLPIVAIIVLRRSVRWVARQEIVFVGICAVTFFVLVSQSGFVAVWQSVPYYNACDKMRDTKADLQFVGAIFAFLYALQLGMMCLFLWIGEKRRSDPARCDSELGEIIVTADDNVKFKV